MRKFIAVFLLSALFVACTSEPKTTHIQVDAGFSDYVNAFTSGVISSQSEIKIILGEPNEKAIPGNNLPDGVLSLSPSISGQAKWVDQQTISFVPSAAFESGQTYEVSFFLGRLADVPAEFQEMKFAFSIITQSLFVSTNGLSAPNVKDQTSQQLDGSIRTSDIAKPTDIEKCLYAQQLGDDLDILWTHDANAKTSYFTIENIKRREAESFVSLEWDGDPIGSDINGEKEIRIPPLGEFTLQEISTQRDPNFHFSIRFSDPIKDNQDLTGLIYLKSGKKLRLVQSENEIKAFPSGQLSSEEVVVINQAIKNASGHELQSAYERTVQFNTTNPAVELLGSGVIMPTTGKVTFPFKAVNLRAVNLRIIRIFEDNVPQFLQDNQLDGNNSLTRVGRMVFDGSIDLFSAEPLDYGVWNNFSIDISNYVKTEPGAIYRVLIHFERSQSLYPCGGKISEVQPLKRRQPRFDDGTGYFNENYWYEGGYDWDEKDDPCSDSYYRYYQRGIAANIIASNIGLIAKESADNNYNVMVTDLNTTNPMAGIEVVAFNFQQQPIGRGKTNASGQVGIQTTSKPYLIKAADGKHKGYLLVDNGSALSVSLYEIGGNKITKGIKGFIYGERGVWRPGDTLHLSFMLEDKLNVLPASHPVLLELYDPKGKLQTKVSNSRGVDGLYAFHATTKDDDPTGNWRAKIIVGNSTFFKSLKIETIKPNRLRIDYDLPEVWPSHKSVETELSAEWLYGSPGSGLKARIQLQVENMKTRFKDYDGYQFDDRTKRFWGGDILESESTTNNTGLAQFYFDFVTPNSAPGMLKMKFNTKVFEPGGDFSQDFISKKYSPYASYVGIKLDKGGNWITALNTEESNAVAIAAVNEKGIGLSKDVEVELYKLNWNWWWEGNGSDELTQYINASSQNLIKTETITIKDGKAIYDLTFDQRTWGRFLIKVKDLESGHSSSHVIYADYPGWYDNDGSGAEAAAMLSIETTKKNYDVGEEMEVTIPSGGVGNVYVTIEKGDKILDQFWVKAEENTTRFTLEATKEMAPNIYVSATLIQPHAQDVNSLPIRMYGIAPVMVNDPSTHLKPTIEAPEEIRPESTFEVQVAEKEGKPMAYSLAVVDEGLLSLTRFKTPDPWYRFYAKEALGIRTWDMYKYVMSAKTGKMTPLLAVGGDEALEYKEDVKANRFKPVVRYFGPFYLKPGEKQNHQVSIPNYIGAVRVMVVAGKDGAYGNIEKEIQVKQPLMVLTTLPRVLGPSERVRIPVNVIAMKDNIKNVEVKISSNDMVTMVGGNSKSLTFTKKGDQTCFFEMDVARKLGVVKIRVDVSSGSETAFEEIELLVRAPNPMISSSENKALAKGQTYSTDYLALGIKGSNDAQITVSKLPDLGLEKHLKYLIRYPHGCIEQTTSSVFPQLFLGNLVALSPEMETKVRNNIQAGLNRLRSFQQSSGGLSYWPGSTRAPSLWGTNYAGHFIVEAKLKGYDLPPGLYEQWVKFQKTEASDWIRDTHGTWRRYGSDLVQAYRLYTLALSGNPDIGAMNRLKNDSKLSDISAWRLAAAYAIIGREDAARELAKGSVVIEPYREMSYSYGSHLRDMAMILETLTYLNDIDRASLVVKDLSNQLKKGWHSTQTRAYAMLAIAKFIGNSSPESTYQFDITLNGKQTNVDTQSPFYQFDISDSELAKGHFEIKNESTQTLFISFVQSGIPIELDQTAVRKDMEMQVTYEDMKGNTLDVSKIKQGQDFKAIVNVSNPGIRMIYKEIALNQIFPSGWQIVNTRVGESDVSGFVPFDFQDIRDDRVYTYFELQRKEEKRFEVLLNATFCGKYYLPGIFCAPMYDESIQALDPGKWVEVIPND